MIPLNKPLICHKKSANIQEVLSTLYPRQHIRLTFSARQALNLIYSGIYEKQGKVEVAVSPMTCFDAILPIIMAGHEPVFIDIDPDTFLMNTNQVGSELGYIQAIHLGGFPQGMDFGSGKILIEDAAQAFGASIGNKPVGSFGKFAAFSFLKNLHALGGGFLLSEDEPEISPAYPPPGKSVILYRKGKRRLESSISNTKSLTNFLYNTLIKLKPADSGTAIQQMSLSKPMLHSVSQQLACRERLISLRKTNAHRLLNLLPLSRYTPQASLRGTDPVYTRMYLLSHGIPAKTIIVKLREKGIAANNLTQDYRHAWQESVFENPVLKAYVKDKSLPVYRQLHKKLFCIPISPNMTEKEINYIAHTLKSL